MDRKNNLLRSVILSQLQQIQATIETDYNNCEEILGWTNLDSEEAKPLEEAERKINCVCALIELTKTTYMDYLALLQEVKEYEPVTLEDFFKKGAEDDKTANP